MNTDQNNPAYSLLSTLGNVLVLVTMFLLALTPGISMTEDLGRHLLLGKIILTEYTIPTTNLLTYTCPDFPFVNHHWLSEVLLYLVHRAIGLNGLILFKALLMTLSLTIAMFTVRAKRISPLNLFTLILCAIAMAYRAHIRPELFTYLGIALYGWLLTRIAETPSPKKETLWWALLILYGILWANAHIYFIFGIGMIGAYLLSCWIFYFATHKQKTAKAPQKETILFLTLCAASCINPNGYRGFLYPLTIFNNYGIGITENISPIALWQTVLNPMLLALPIITAITLYALIATGIRWRSMAPITLTRLIITTTALIAAWCMARSAPLLALTLPPLLASILNIRCSMFNVRCSIFSTATIILLNVFLIVTILNGSYARIFPSPIGPTPFGLDNEDRYMALRRLQEQGLNGPIFNDYNIGSLVEYNLYPTPAYTDNRPEAFPVSFWQEEYLPALNDLNTWNRMLEQRDIQTIIVSIAGLKEPFIRMMMHNPAWQLIHLDFFCAAWARKSPQNETILTNATYTYDDLNTYRDTIAECIRTLDQQPFWKRQIIADQIVYELYSLICIDQQSLAWPLVLQMHLRYPDYQLIHELMRVSAPPDAQHVLFDLMKKQAQWPLAAKQIIDYVHACQHDGQTNEAQRAARRGRLFFPLNPQLTSTDWITNTAQ